MGRKILHKIYCLHSSMDRTTVSGTVNQGSTPCGGKLSRAFEINEFLLPILFLCGGFFRFLNYSFGFSFHIGKIIFFYCFKKRFLHQIF